MWNIAWQTIIGGLVLTFLAYVGAKWKRIWIRLKAIWNGTNKGKTQLSAAQFEELKVLLRPIQPDANGGSSLKDLHIKIDEFKTEMRADVKEIKDRQVVIGDTAARLEGSLQTHMDTPNAHGGRGRR